MTIVALIGGSCAAMVAGAQPSIIVRDTTLPELSGAGVVNSWRIKVRLSAPSTQTITVVATFTGITAEKGVSCGSTADFLGSTKTLTFPSNSTEQTLDLFICGDDLVEGNETLRLTLSNAVNATVGGEAIITIADNDGVLPPRVFISSVTPPTAFVENVPNTLNPVFAVRLSPASTQSVEVKYQFVDETATRGSACSGNTDYVAASSTLVFAPGETDKTISAVICADTHVDAPIETFVFKLTSATNAVLGAPTPTSGNLPTDAGTSRRLQIIDDDRPVVTVSGTGVESNGGQTAIMVTMTLNRARTAPFVLGYSTALAGVLPYPATSGTSCVGSADYVAIPPATVTYAPNEVTKTITLSVCGDTLIERDEQLQLALTSPNGPELNTSSGGGIKIINDDMPLVTVVDRSVPVSDSSTPVDLELTALLAPKPGEPATVSYRTADGSLIGGPACTGSVGYITTSGTLSFSGGQSDLPPLTGTPGQVTTDFTQTRKFIVRVCKRSTSSALAVKILLSNPTNAKLSGGATIKIVNPIGEHQTAADASLLRSSAITGSTRAARRAGK